MKKKKFLIVLACVVSLAIIGTSYVSKLKDRTLIKPELSHNLPIGFDSAYVQSLVDLGMNTTKEAKLLSYTKQRAYWKKECGLPFMGDDEMKQFLSDNNFILAEANRYKYMIPIEAGKELILNCKKVKEKERAVYVFWNIGGSGTYLTQDDLNVTLIEGQSIYTSSSAKHIKQEAIEKYHLNVDNYGNLRRELSATYKIYIIGSVKDFNTDGLILEDNILKMPPPKDPIAVLKTNDGYIELTNWQ